MVEKTVSFVQSCNLWMGDYHPVFFSDTMEKLEQVEVDK